MKDATMEPFEPVLESVEGLNRTFMESLSQRESACFVTLGPEETSSYRAALRMCVLLAEGGNPCRTSIATYPKFDLAYRAFKEGRGDFLFVPNAYEGITRMYWDHELAMSYSFIYPTPMYGLAGKSRRPFKEPLVVASCPAVQSLLPALMIPELASRQLDFLIADSTTQSAQWVASGLADLAITNETSSSRYGLEFLSTVKGVPMLWTLFERKHA